MPLSGFASRLFASFADRFWISRMNFDTHRAGLLLHPTSLPSGTLADAERWLDFMQAAGFGGWRNRQRHWLDDYARFIILKAEHGGAPWTDWPVPLRDRAAQALAEFDVAHADALKAVMVEQYRAAVHWRGRRGAGGGRGLPVFGDLPVFVR